MKTFENTTSEGFTYVGLLLLIVFFGLGSVGAARVLASSERGEKEQELLFVGEQFRAAIGAYYSAGSGRRYPEKLELLLEDSRYPTPVRHLRRIYPDPITGNSEWGLVMAPEGGIMGVFSLSDREPMKRTDFESPNQRLNDAVLLAEKRDAPRYSYQDWQFVYAPGNTVAVTGVAAAAIKSK